MIRFAFYGRVSTEDQQDPESSKGWQLTRSRALIESRGGVIVTEFFDVDKSRSIPWQRRPEATALLAELKNPSREFDAVVIGSGELVVWLEEYPEQRRCRAGGQARRFVRQDHADGVLISQRSSCRADRA